MILAIATRKPTRQVVNWWLQSCQINDFRWNFWFKNFL